MSMDINMTSMANLEISLNKANTGQQILMKTLEKSAQTAQAESAETPRPVVSTGTEKQGRINRDYPEALKTG